jgi:hypothetical protein|tara:strand:+ start:1945 stop:2097 length:153 start_codon:yes stop_codon:yes gene_type:complete
MELSDIKNKLEEAVDTENWDIIVEVIEELDLKTHYIPPYETDDSDEEIWG